MSVCRSCGAEILWVETPTGKPMPLDDKPVTMWIVDPSGPLEGSRRGRPVQVRPSHFANCPQAKEWRKPT